MLDLLLYWDQQAFMAIHGFRSDLLETIMPMYRHMYFWAPFYVFLMVFLVVNFQRQGLIILIFAVLAVGSSDLLSSRAIKKTVQRPRPCQEAALQGHVDALVRCGSGYSFTSSHAANHGSLAFFLIFLFGRALSVWRWVLLLWAASIGMAQVYVGVHYPLDIIGGLLVGLLTGGLFVGVYLRVFGRPQLPDG